MYSDVDVLCTRSSKILKVSQHHGIITILYPAAGAPIARLFHHHTTVCLSGLSGGSLIKQYGARRLAVCGSVLCSAATFIIAYAVSRVYSLIVIYGVVGKYSVMSRICFTIM